MDIAAIQSLCNNLEQYSAQMRQRIDDLKREASQVENDSGKLKKRIMAEVTAMAASSPNISNSARVVEQQYRIQQKAGDDHAKSLKDTVSAIEKHLSEVDSVYAELRKHETYMRDMEQKITAWASKANDLMTRTSI